MPAAGPAYRISGKLPYGGPHIKTPWRFVLQGPNLSGGTTLIHILCIYALFSGNDGIRHISMKAWGRVQTGSNEDIPPCYLLSWDWRCFTVPLHRCTLHEVFMCIILAIKFYLSSFFFRFPAFFAVCQHCGVIPVPSFLQTNPLHG